MRYWPMAYKNGDEREHPLIGRSITNGTKPQDGLLLMTSARSYRLFPSYTCKFICQLMLRRSKPLPWMTTTNGSLLERKSLSKIFWQDIESSRRETGLAAAAPGWNASILQFTVYLLLFYTFWSFFIFGFFLFLFWKFWRPQGITWMRGSGLFSKRCFATSDEYVIFCWQFKNKQ